MKKDFNPCEVCECDPCDCYDGCEPIVTKKDDEKNIKKIDREEEFWKMWGNI